MAALLVLSGCGNMKNKKPPAPKKSFTVCYGYGCNKNQKVELSDEQWLVIEHVFSTKAANAKTERQQIAKAIAQMETFVGEITHTSNDLPGTFEALFQDLNDQMDCVDEAKNTTIYLKLFRQRGLINFHKEGYRINRGFFLNGWPHTSAMMKDINTSDAYAVDSWFHKNGVQPEIIPAEVWYSGWEPEPKNTK